MDDAKLTPEILVAALRRTAEIQGSSAMVVRKGYDEVGAVVVKLWQPDVGSRVFAQSRDRNSTLGWRCISGNEPVSETVADQLIERESRIDPDLWVLEITSRTGALPFATA